MTQNLVHMKRSSVNSVRNQSRGTVHSIEAAKRRKKQNNHLKVSDHLAIHWSGDHNTSSDHLQSVIKSTQLPPDLQSDH